MKHIVTLLLMLAITVTAGAQNDFSISAVPDSIWQLMQGKSYVANPHIQRSDLRYLRLLHWDYDEKEHRGELICNKLIAKHLLAIFKELHKAKYPIQSIQLPDVFNADDERQMRSNNTSCFCYRVISGSSRLSYHARGLAIDINPLYNPQVVVRGGKTKIAPTTAGAYVNRDKDFKYKIDRNDLAYRLFTKYGFTWGGSWKHSKDYQHFEFHTK